MYNILTLWENTMIDYEERQDIIKELSNIQVKMTHLLWAYNKKDLMPILNNKDMEWPEWMVKFFEEKLEN
jgi:hypothetical protein